MDQNKLISLKIMKQSAYIKKLGHYSYNEKDLLGEGAYGKVYEGLDSRMNI